MEGQAAPLLEASAMADADGRVGTLRSGYMEGTIPVMGFVRGGACRVYI